MKLPKHFGFYRDGVMVAKVAGCDEAEAKRRLRSTCQMVSNDICLGNLTITPIDNRYGWTMDTLILEQDIKVWEL